jgi:hypothetical protein
MAEEFVPGPLDAPGRREAGSDAAAPRLRVDLCEGDSTRQKTLRGRTFSCTGETFAVYDAYHDANDPTVLLVAVRGRRAELDHRRYADGRDERESGTDDGSIARGLLQRD